MGRRYATSGGVAVASPTKSALSVISSTTIRSRVYDIIFGSTATPADNALEFIVQRCTTAGTGDAKTPTPLDPADPASTSASKANFSAEPTYTSGLILLDIPMNQRSTQRWVAVPGGELVLPATASNGLGIQPVHASFTGATLCTIHFEE